MDAFKVPMAPMSGYQSSLHRCCLDIMSSSWFKRAAKVVGIGVGTGVAVFVAPPLLGFTTAGVAAGSAAALIQSVVYGGAVQAGSAFATMQSVGATATIVPALVAGSGAAGVAGVVVAAEGGDNNDGNDNGGGHHGHEEGGGGNAGGGNGGGHPGGRNGGSYGHPAPRRRRRNRNTDEDSESADSDSDDDSQGNGSGTRSAPPPYEDKHTNIQQELSMSGEEEFFKLRQEESGKHKKAVVRA
ncbi:hypothetical protein OPQ81_002322 [Rhizoctonia solani]|nr:hypothetical protein OPQ81_002322 [Rhizoctonia solani]